MSLLPHSQQQPMVQTAIDKEKESATPPAAKTSCTRNGENIYQFDLLDLSIVLALGRVKFYC